MYLNRLTLIGFIGGDAETKTISNGTAFTAFSVATQTFVEELAGRVGIPYRMASLRFVRQVGGVRGDYRIVPVVTANRASLFDRGARAT
jgi:hypothetical protein